MASTHLSKPKLLFFATEDWFVRSHFMPLVRRAQAEGFDVAVLARASGALGGDVRVIEAPFPRGSMRPWDLAGQIAHLRGVLDSERPDIVHAIALKPMALLAQAGWREGGQVFALTGRGYLGVRRTPWTGMVNHRLRGAMRRALLRPRTLLLVENADDRDWLSVSGDLDDTTLLMPGAGVDPAAYAPAPEPPEPPIVVGIVARLIWTKGIDLAVEAVQRLRAQGENIVLRIAGDVDPESPEAVSANDLARWRSLDGVDLLGRIDDVSGFWAGAHIACLPSRGGEGLPRSLLEAAACARPIVTSDAPGCRDFVTESTGVVVPRNDAAALAKALQRLAHDAGRRAAMGASARARVVSGYSEAHAADVAAQAWRRLRRA